MTSGLVCSEKILWICFHGIFDFAYLLKLLSGESTLPDNEYSFQEMLKLYFPRLVDVKTLSEPWPQLQGSLNKLSQDLDVFRSPPVDRAHSRQTPGRKRQFDDGVDILQTQRLLLRKAVSYTHLTLPTICSV
eukprot:TRINITY_DN1960_c0_g1_i13.p1 TRINITY_DN1960_c0_g1~~TRINITY_DN1960_c0_g1_i13.p1  ORF type:complete len:132 (-),score=9.87 TRINITY_DN1960_c0_g1_i13:57-452(-)